MLNELAMDDARGAFLSPKTATKIVHPSTLAVILRNQLGDDIANEFEKFLLGAELTKHQAVISQWLRNQENTSASILADQIGENL